MRKKCLAFRFLNRGLSGMVLLLGIISCNSPIEPVNRNDLDEFKQAKDSIIKHFDFFMANRDNINDKGITYYGGASFEADEQKLDKLYKLNGQPKFLFPVVALFRNKRIVKKADCTSPLAINRDSTIAFCINEQYKEGNDIVDILYFDALDRPSFFGEECVARTDTIFKMANWTYFRNFQPKINN